jgi:cell wall-associated NlpC family hydrolase
MHIKAMFLIGFAVSALAACAVRLPAEPDGGPSAGTAPPTHPETTTEVPFMALALVGKPYAARGASPDTGFDCSGLVAYVYARALQVSLPRNTFDLARTGTPIEAGELQPGDLVFFNTLRRPFSHVGIYVGDLRFVHAPSTGGVVRVEDMRLAYWTKRFDGARRIAF